MKTIVKSIRLDKKTLNQIDEMAASSKETFSSFTSELIEEAIKMRRCPGIMFDDGPAGRRARIQGTGLEVWEVIQGYQSLNNNFNALKKAFHWLTENQLLAVIGYAKAYPDEINALIGQNRVLTPEKVEKELPFARRKH